jgi:molecular chaperone HtpG
MNNKISVTADNIFPIIKKFLYSDNEIFIRELLSNAVDATIKLKTLYNIGKIKYLNNINIHDDTIIVQVNSKNNTIEICDQGLGMTKEEVNKYINQIAFSGAEDFIKKYNTESKNIENIIGHFGLGFYSSFMVADKVEIITKSYKHNTSPVHWICEGSPDFIFKPLNDDANLTHGTRVILHINNNNNNFLNFVKIKELLLKYCKFMPIPIKLEFIDLNNDSNNKTEIINNTSPLWIKKPLEINNEDYVKCYKELYPLDKEDPLFWIHLNIDYPFKLHGILFFPKKNNVNIDVKNKIHLYQNQVFVTDNLENIVPDFLMFLRGVIDSPNIPLNVSRSYLQSDNLVKKISNYISRKVADKFIFLFKDNRKNFENQWKEIKIVVEYGILTDVTFFNKLKDIILYQTVDNKFYTLSEYINIIKNNQTNKEGKTVILYTNNETQQDLYIRTAIKHGYNVIKLDSPLVNHFIQKIENEYKNIIFVRVNAGSVNDLIKKDNNIKQLSLLTDDQKNILKTLFEKELDKNKFIISLNEDMLAHETPIIIYIPEMERRISDIESFYSHKINATNIQKYHVIINPNNKLMYKIINTFNNKEKSHLIKHCINLALISQNMLHGKELTDFIMNEYKYLTKNN